MADRDATKTVDREVRKARQAEDGRRAMIEYENALAAMRAKTAKLRALRLARDAEAVVATDPAPPAKKIRKKKK